MLTFLPTPIGNLEDITLRVLEALRNVDILLCEDTRVTKRLIALLIERSLLPHKTYKYFSLHSHNHEEFFSKTDLDFFCQNIAYVSDAGMPCISDPGIELVRFLQKNNLPYDAFGGTTALTLAITLSGMVEKEFIFLGFLAHKIKEKEEFLRKYLSQKIPFILYESPHRLLETLKIVSAINENCEVFLAKELTKKYQRTFKGNIKEILEDIKEKEIKGEWVIVLQGKENENLVLSENEIYMLDIPPKIKAKILAKLHNKPVSDFYNSLCEKN